MSLLREERNKDNSEDSQVKTWVIIGKELDKPNGTLRDFTVATCRWMVHTKFVGAMTSSKSINTDPLVSHKAASVSADDEKLSALKQKTSARVNKVPPILRAKITALLNMGLLKLPLLVKIRV